MIFQKQVIQEIEVKTLRCDIGVRYYEDGEVNGVQDSDDNPQIPLVENGRWRIDIDLDTGKINNWPEGTTAFVHYKVCDDGRYQLLDANDNIVADVFDYVPSMLSPEEDGWGDYVIMNIDESGQIKDWKADLNYFYEKM
jgi:hypothetical protein